MNVFFRNRYPRHLRNLRDKVAALTDQTQKLLAYPEAKGQRNGSNAASVIADEVMTEVVAEETGLTEEELEEALRPPEQDALHTMQSIEVKLRRSSVDD